MIAVVSPSFVRSEWCRREWEIFEEREQQLREQDLLDEEQGLIFPIVLFPLDRGRFHEDEESFARVAQRRQWLDMTSRLGGTPIRPDQTRLLAEQLIDAEAELERRRRVITGAPAAASDITIRDPARRIEWAGALSPTALSYEEAIEYVNQLSIGGNQGWRLPTREELESVIDLEAYDPEADPEESNYPLREPFNAQRFGRLHSGTLVGSNPGNWMMNVRNGHIFNGGGVNAYVRAVRDLE
jgi:uncharacterized protein DUF1566